MSCDNKFATSKFISDPWIREAKTAFFGRIRTLGIFVIIAILIITFATKFAFDIYSSISTYRYMTNQMALPTSMSSGTATIASASYDNEEYANENDEILFDEYNQFKRNMANVKQLYAEYNSKVTEYQKSINQEPTDVIDERLMLREHDNY